MELFQVDSCDEARAKLRIHCPEPLEAVERPLAEALGMTLARAIRAGEDIPPFSRATVDGYAVRASDAYAASDSIPAFLDVVGQVDMGQANSIVLGPGQAAYVPTGGMLPEGADAMVMIEDVEALDDRSIAVNAGSAAGRSVMRRGEDIEAGASILAAGHRLRPQDLGALAALGITRVDVRRPPRVAVISTGDEIVDPAAPVSFGQIRDINGVALAALCESCGAIATSRTIVPDEADALQTALRTALSNCDVALISGGSSMGAKDMTKQAIAALGPPGVLTHGLAIKPGKPTIVGVVGGKAVFGLPGHPASAIMVFHAIVKPHLEALLGRTPQPSAAITARLTENIPADPGKESYQMVALQRGTDAWQAHPIHGKSGAITLLTRAHGYFTVERDREGVRAGESVEVVLF